LAVTVGTGTNPIAYSSDGINWNQATINNFKNVNGIASNNTNRIVAVGSGIYSIMYSSDNGSNWTGVTGSSSILSAGYAVAVNAAGTQWVVTGLAATGTSGSSVMYSSDGINWSRVGSFYGSDFIGYTVTVNTIGSTSYWVMGGNSSSYTIYYSTNSTTWTSTLISKEIYTIVGDGLGNWVGVGPGTGNYQGIVYSGAVSGLPKLDIWGTVMNFPSFFNIAYDVAYYNNYWVVVGSGSSSIAYTTTSSLGTWSVVPSSTANILSVGYAVANDGNGIWMVGGVGASSGSGYPIALASTSPSSWNVVSVDPYVSIVNDITTYGSGYFAVTGTGQYTVSYCLSNPSNWVPAYNSTGILPYGNAIIYSTPPGYQRIIVVGSNSIGYSLAPTGGTVFLSSVNYSNTQSYNNVAFNGNMWLAVSQSPNPIFYSLNGTSWNGLTTTILANANAVVWYNTFWFAGGSGGTDGTNNGISIAYSPDGVIWTLSNNTIFTNCLSIATNTRTLVAVGTPASVNSPIAYSTDGKIWTVATSSNSLFLSGSGVAWNGSLWVATGTPQTTGSSGASIAYSSDGVNWKGVTGSTSIFSSANSIGWNGSQWVSVGTAQTTGTSGANVAYSSDGINWNGTTSLSFLSPVNEVTWDGNLWLVVGTGATSNPPPIAYSSDGINWSQVSSASPPTTNFSIGNGVAWSGKSPSSVYIQQPFIAGGSGINSLAYSADGFNWRGLGNNIFSQCNAVKWNGNLWVAGGSGATASIAYSSDGINWTPVSNSLSLSTQINGIEWNGTIWAATGTYKSPYSTFTSSDGKNWSNGSNPFSGSAGQTIKWNGYYWIAGGTTTTTNSIVYSTDAKTWNHATAPSGLPSIIYGIDLNDSMWIAVGGGSSSSFSIAYSYDSTNWKSLPNSLNIFTSGYGIAWNNIMWVAVGTGNNAISNSYDGFTWNNVNVSSSIFTTGYAVSWTGKKWIAVGSYGSSTTSYSMVYSYDGFNWYPVNNFTPTSSQIPILTTGYAIASNSGIGAVVVPSQLTLSNYNIPSTQTLDIVSNSYYNSGYNNFTATIKSYDL
jgi:hypothetical protein